MRETLQPGPPAAAAYNPAPVSAQRSTKPAPSPEDERRPYSGKGSQRSIKLYSAANAGCLADLFIDDASIIDLDGVETVR